jgi:hypothetical protein
MKTRHVLLTLAVLGVIATFGLFEGNRIEKGGGGNNGGSFKPPVFKIDFIPTPPEADFDYVNSINNLGMITGWYYLNGNPNPFLYNHPNGVFFDLNHGAAKFKRPIPTGWRLCDARCVNDKGDIVGTAEDAGGVSRGYFIQTDLSPDMATWTFDFLPDLQSDHSSARHVNIQGDILGFYQRPDGTMDAYLYNPWNDGPVGLPPTQLGLEDVLYAELNNSSPFRQVAGCQRDGTAFLFEEGHPLKILTDANYRTVTGINDSGVFCGHAVPFEEDHPLRIFAGVNYRTVTGINNPGVFGGQAVTGPGSVGPRKDKAEGIAYRFTNRVEPLMKEAWAKGINENGDVVARRGGDHVAYLFYTRDPQNPGDDQIFDIAAVDLNSVWNNNSYVREIQVVSNQRDATGFSRMAGRIWLPGKIRSVVLTNAR